MKKLLYIIFVTSMLFSCSYLHEKHQAGVVAEIGNHKLYQYQVDSLTAQVAPEDSAQTAQAYIRQWAKEILVYDKARDRQNPDLEALVEDYRRSLYVHAYEQYLISRHMSTHVEDSLVVQYYETHSEQLELHESIIQGILLVVPLSAPNSKKLMKWLTECDKEENIEHIEKYAYQYASGYELFTDQWRSANQLLLRLPMAPDDFQKELKRHPQIVVSDSLNTYYLQVTDKHLVGEVMPEDYAAEEIRHILLTERQVPFLENERDQLYEEALLFGKLKLYEK